MSAADDAFSAAVLSWWRTLPPYRVRERRRDLLSHLVALTCPLVEDALVASALAGETAAALIIADDLGEDVHPDLVASWIAWAAAERDRLATLALVELLEEEARNRALDDEELPDDDPFGLSAPRGLAEEWRTSLWSLAFHTGEGREGVAKLLDRQRQIETKMDAASNDQPTRAHPTERPAAPPSDGPTLLVVRAIGEADSREGKAIDRAYASLTTPLPLAGGRLDPACLATTLRLTFPWMGAAVDAVEDDLALRRAAGVPWLRLRPMLLVGPPGVGKTRFARCLARLAGTGCGEVSAAGSADNRMLAGTARGWSSTQPAYPLLLMRRCGTANPIVVVDEVDKARASHNGDLHATLLSFLEAETARAWHDECLLASCDLGEVSWILTANAVDTLPPPLLSRLRVVRVEGPAPEDFDAVLHSVLRDLADELGVTPADLPTLEPEAVDRLRSHFARGGDVRRLQAAITRALAASAGRRLGRMQ